MEKLDVSVKYYPETGKNHDIGYISFRDGMGSILDSDRIELHIHNGALYFKKPVKGKGLRLNNSKIQLWSLAQIAKDWEGEYPLKFDPEKSCYKIMYCDRQEEDKNQGSRLNIPVQYTPHKKEVVSDQPKQLSGVEQIVIDTLFEALLSSTDLKEAKSIAISIRALLDRRNKK